MGTAGSAFSSPTPLPFSTHTSPSFLCRCPSSLFFFYHLCPAEKEKAEPASDATGHPLARLDERGLARQALSRRDCHVVSPSPCFQFVLFVAWMLTEQAQTATVIIRQRHGSQRRPQRQGRGTSGQRLGSKRQRLGSTRQKLGSKRQRHASKRQGHGSQSHVY